MKNTGSNLQNPLTKLATAFVALALCGSGLAYAQDNLVVSPEQAKSVQTQIQLDLSEDAIVDNLEDDQQTRIEPETPEYEQESLAPAIVETSEQTDFTVGVLASEQGEGSDLYRDPFDVDNTEISPIYPEGVYVDYMRTDAGINLTSKF